MPIHTFTSSHTALPHLCRPSSSDPLSLKNAGIQTFPSAKSPGWRITQCLCQPDPCTFTRKPRKLTIKGSVVHTSNRHRRLEFVVCSWVLGLLACVNQQTNRRQASTSGRPYPPPRRQQRQQADPGSTEWSEMGWTG